ncbi:efflux RND transporter periplasmic adaptor subunit [Candidatus Peregrinibacteria bacterium]|nr:efflux RND transporter periplasmic adaptor subunit [Candidatus Peregrinibacteria bacterium]
MHQQKQLHKKTKFYKNKKLMIFLGIVAMSIATFIYYSQKEAPITYDTIVAEKSELIQEVSVTGKVEPSQSVDLSFETSGRVSAIYVDVGDQVKKGQELLRLNSADVQAMLNQAYAGANSAKAQLQQYEAGVRSQEAKLAELKQGTRPEEIQIAETNVSNAEEALSDAEKNLESVKNKTAVDLSNAYSSALNSLPSAVTKAKSALIIISDIQYAHFVNSSLYSNQIESAKAIAVQSLLGAFNAGKWTSEFISRENGGTFGLVQQVVANPTNDKIAEALIKTLNALEKVKTALDSVPSTSELTATEKLNLDTEKININTQITAVQGYNQTISATEVGNQNLISTAEAGVNTAKNALLTAQNNLSLKKAGYTQEQIKAQEAMVEQAKANLASQKAMVNQAYANVQQYQAQLEKTVLRAPMDGIVTKMEAKVGEIIFPSSSTYEIQIPLISLIGEGNFEMEANIAEIDIAKIKIGNTAKVTLDAYSEVEFTATVTFVDPAETYVEGIPTYRVKLQFDEQDERIKSGMTANIDILTAKKEDVISIPQRSVISKDNMKLVRIAEENNDEGITTIKEVEVLTGLKSSDGRVEIIKGIQEGDKIVTNIND